MASSLAILAPAGLLAGCAGSSGSGLATTSALAPVDRSTAGTAPLEPAKVALLLPLTGGIQLSLLAKGLQQAAELALFERNVQGLQLIVRDDLGTPEGAAKAATEALAEGAEIILGPLFGASVKSVAPIARQAGVPVIAFSNDPAVSGNGVYLLSFFASSEATRLAQHAVAQGRRHFAALIPSDDLGKDTEPAFRSAVEASGGRIALIERYAPDLRTIAEPSERIAAAIQASADSDTPIDALFLPSGTDNVARLLAMVRHHKIDTTKVKLLATSGWDNPSALRNPTANGAWMAAPDPAGWREFTARFGKAHNALPPRLASLVYDAVSISAAFATGPKSNRFTAANLTRPIGFAGIDGPIRLPGSGLAERGLAILEVQPQGLVMVAPAAGFGAMPATPQSVQAGQSEFRRG